MKRILFLLALVPTIFTGGAAIAQNAVTARNSFIYGTAPTYYTKTDSVTNTGVDTFGTASNPYRNSVGLEARVLKISGNAAGSYVQFWGSKDANQRKAYKLLRTDTVANVSYQQVFSYDVGTSGIGNPYRWYLVTYNGVGTAVNSWYVNYFVR